MPKRRLTSIRAYTNQNLLFIALVLLGIFLVINLVPRTVLKNDTVNDVNIVANSVKVLFSDRATGIEQLLDQVDEAIDNGNLTHEQINSILATITHNHPQLASIEVIDSKGQVTCASPMDSIAMDRSGEGFYQGAIQSERYYWSDVFTFFQSGKPVIGVTRKSKDNLIQAYINLELFSTSSLAVQKQFGDTFRIAVMDSHGTYVMNSDPEAIYQRAQNDEFQAIEHAVSQKVSNFDSSDGQKLVSATYVEALHWYIALYVDKAETYYTINLINGILMVATVLIAVFLWLFYVRFNRVSASIRRFSQEINRFATNLETGSLADEPFLELDHLTHNFQNMGRSLKHVSDELHTYAYRDILTGLLNRRAAMDVLGQLIRDQQPMILCYFDLDRFKEINDKLGHSTGDKFLQMVTERLKATVADPDSLFRVGGDEFIYIMSEADSQANVAQQIDDILTEFKRPYVYERDQYFLGVSVGTACYPQDADNIDDLLKYADIAMYKAKTEGTGFQTFNHEIQQCLLRELHIKRRLQNADYFPELYYEMQPQCAIDTGRILGFEMFVRWNNPELGPIYPNEFIPIAEASFTVTHITYWMFDRAMEVLGLLDAHGHAKDKVAINISVIDLLSENFVAELERRARANAVPPDRIELEVTEGVIIHNYEQIKTIISQLSRLGFQIALDDFGKGYSSLAHLNELEINTLKIDKEFLDSACSNDRSRELIKSIIDVSQRLSIDIIVEGVETPEQMDLLAGMHAHGAQGYLLSRPFRQEALVAFLENHG